MAGNPLALIDFAAEVLAHANLAHPGLSAYVHRVGLGAGRMGAVDDGQSSPWDAVGTFSTQEQCIEAMSAGTQ
jgi:hypothetical protein